MFGIDLLTHRFWLSNWISDNHLVQQSCPSWQCYLGFHCLNHNYLSNVTPLSFETIGFISQRHRFVIAPKYKEKETLEKKCGAAVQRCLPAFSSSNVTNVICAIDIIVTIIICLAATIDIENFASICCEITFVNCANWIGNWTIVVCLAAQINFNIWTLA